jgi:hypothetical protein
MRYRTKLAPGKSCYPQAAQDVRGPLADFFPSTRSVPLSCCYTPAKFCERGFPAPFSPISAWTSRRQLEGRSSASYARKSFVIFRHYQALFLTSTFLLPFAFVRKHVFSFCP